MMNLSKESKHCCGQAPVTFSSSLGFIMKHRAHSREGLSIYTSDEAKLAFIKMKRQATMRRVSLRHSESELISVKLG